MWHVFSCALQRASEKTTYRRSSRIFKTKTKEGKVGYLFLFSVNLYYKILRHGQI